MTDHPRHTGDGLVNSEGVRLMKCDLCGRTEPADRYSLECMRCKKKYQVCSPCWEAGRTTIEIFELLHGVIAKDQLPEALLVLLRQNPDLLPLGAYAFAGESPWVCTCFGSSDTFLELSRIISTYPFCKNCFRRVTPVQPQELQAVRHNFNKEDWLNHCWSCRQPCFCGRWPAWSHDH